MFFETKDSSILIQAWWRGVQARSKLPQYKKEKQERDVSLENNYRPMHVHVVNKVLFIILLAKKKERTWIPKEEGNIIRFVVFVYFLIE